MESARTRRTLSGSVLIAALACGVACDGEIAGTGATGGGARGGQVGSGATGGEAGSGATGGDAGSGGMRDEAFRGGGAVASGTSVASTTGTGTGAGSGGGGGGPRCGLPLLIEDFEDGEFTDSLDHEPGEGAVAVVSTEDGAEPYSGERCLRGNFRVGYTDPITGLAAPDQYSGLEIPLGGIDRFYLSVRYRIDADAQWVMDDGQDTGLGYKFFYLMGTPWNNTLNWVLAQLWSSDHWWFGDNQPDDNSGYQVQADVPTAVGAWHHMELVLELNSSPGAADGRFLLRLDGAAVVDLDDVPFQTSTVQKFGTLGGVPMMYGGCCGAKYPFGWQIDELEVYELPAGCDAP